MKTVTTQNHCLLRIPLHFKLVSENITGSRLSHFITAGQKFPNKSAGKKFTRIGSLSLLNQSSSRSVQSTLPQAPRGLSAHMRTGTQPQLGAKALPHCSARCAFGNEIIPEIAITDLLISMNEHLILASNCY